MRNRSSFDSIARYYDALARIVFGKSIRKAQTCFLTQIPVEGKILVLGGGTGWWLREVLRGRPKITILYVDSSGEMIARARAHSHEDDRIVFRQATEKSLTEFDQFDAIITFFYLDLFNNERLKQLVKELKSTLKTDGYWLVADFKKDSWWHRLMLFMMYLFFGTTTDLKNQQLPKWENIMTESGLKVFSSKLYYGRFIQSVLYRNQ